MKRRRFNDSESIFSKKVQASLVIPFLVLFFITSLMTVAFYQIRLANANQYRLLKDTYQLKIMLELTTQNLESNLILKEDVISYPKKIKFSTGVVKIKWDEKSQLFELMAELPNGSKRSEIVYIVFKEKKVIEKKTVNEFVS